MSYYVYILESEKTGRFYIGQTNNISTRLHHHNSGYSRYTKHGIPWKLKFYKKLPTRSESVKLERRLKNIKSRLGLQEWMQKNSK
ncbi:MAG: GIY-YIG nuclease family protein [Bacteroidota bacterium]|nr:GIY-YIG nuclease family protein [Bacteroidota bacterium]MDZ7741733.1 GIY-YIG nuclease family protein [Bacteroidota bacterium]MDZ7741734.1 GIY-YIG nuclease family protein [Bacteroidota bacterium]